jgi:MFS family permease
MIFALFAEAELGLILGLAVAAVLYSAVVSRSFRSHAQRITSKQLGVALIAGMLALCVAFVAGVVIAALWYDYTDPHDGQSGIAAFATAILIAPSAALLAFFGVLSRLRTSLRFPPKNR